MRFSDTYNVAVMGIGGIPPMTIKDIVSQCGLNEDEQFIFKDYIRNRFGEAKELEAHDMSFLDLWDRILYYAELFGADRAINKKVCPDRPVQFRSPETLEIKMYQSYVGKIPIIYVRNKEDFEELVTNIAYKGIRPDGISTTGAFFIFGKTTRFIILSSKPYSNVPAVELGLSDEADWTKKSMLLRRGHECTHYFTKQTYGISNNILHDEIMADFIGIYETFGFYKAEWFLRFLGIIEGSGGRLDFYVKGLPKRVREAVSRTVELAASGLERWSQMDVFKSMSEPERIIAMCKNGIKGMTTEM